MGRQRVPLHVRVGGQAGRCPALVLTLLLRAARRRLAGMTLAPSGDLVGRAPHHPSRQVHVLTTFNHTLWHLASHHHLTSFSNKDVTPRLITLRSSFAYLAHLLM